MTGWSEYTYLVELAAGEDLYNLLRTVGPAKAEIVPRIEWVVMLDENARDIIAAGPDLTRTGFRDVYLFDGDTSKFDGWMAQRHPDIDYKWVVQVYVAVADQAVRADLDFDLRRRILSVEPRATAVAA